MDPHSTQIIAFFMDGGQSILDTNASATVGAVLSQVQNGVERVIALWE